ncbi:hypothetical protein GH714_003632 [Hevea brasiliensis]|uniref:Reverse transcriptase Ty1/copia-type domain-containing protein n=1 Tax=Hevea brasiliensis TaxID=3981 RepID=A0A6A6KXA8_HEVBR|nr:hypothetical protein GH714_003632 [Hevea brasiliensis]
MTDLGLMGYFLGLEVRQYGNWAGCIDDRKSTTGYAFSLGSCVICWNSKKQPSTALSSSESEYMAVTLAACQAIGLRRIMEDMKLTQVEATTVYCDNQSTIAMAKNPVYHSRTRRRNSASFCERISDKRSNQDHILQYR